MLCRQQHKQRIRSIGCNAASNCIKQECLRLGLLGGKSLPPNWIEYEGIKNVLYLYCSIDRELAIY